MAGLYEIPKPPCRPQGALSKKEIIPLYYPKSNKTPAFLRREGRRKRKAGAKMKKLL